MAVFMSICSLEWKASQALYERMPDCWLNGGVQLETRPAAA
jgi:hypothetical protein